MVILQLALCDLFFRLHAINLAHGIVIYLESLFNRNPRLEPFRVESNHERVAGPKASSSRHDLVGIAQEGHIHLGCTGQRCGPGHSAHRTCGKHSPWPGGVHARGRIHSCLVSNKHPEMGVSVNETTHPWSQRACQPHHQRIRREAP